MRASSSLALLVLATLALLSTLFLVQVTAAGGGGDEAVDDPDVLKLDDSNFQSTVAGEELMLVEFYAPVR